MGPLPLSCANNFLFFLEIFSPLLATLLHYLFKKNSVGEERLSLYSPSFGSWVYEIKRQQVDEQEKKYINFLIFNITYRRTL